jgi:2-polyprenyl-3-methyl-5-hydroxy-6-metoxy-1,4-benzoquinol methylase
MSINDCFFDELFDITKLSSREKYTASDVDFIRLNANQFGHNRILDLACGTGRLAIPLSQCGFSVTGVDCSQHYIERATEKALSLGLACDFFVLDDRDLNKTAEYDIVISMFSSFGYHSDAENELVVNNISNSLIPGGVFILQIHNKSACIREETKSDFESGYLITKYHQFYPSTNRMIMNWKYHQRGILKKSSKFAFRVYSAHEILTLLMKSGLTPITLYSSTNHDPYVSSSKQMVLVARKLSAL